MCIKSSKDSPSHANSDKQAMLGNLDGLLSSTLLQGFPATCSMKNDQEHIDEAMVLQSLRYFHVGSESTIFFVHNHIKQRRKERDFRRMWWLSFGIQKVKHELRGRKLTPTMGTPYDWFVEAQI